jgi:hypothetical protein
VVGKDSVELVNNVRSNKKKIELPELCYSDFFFNRTVLRKKIALPEEDISTLILFCCRSIFKKNYKNLRFFVLQSKAILQKIV